MLLKSMEMERVLADSFPGKTLEDFLAQERSEVEAKVSDAKKAIVDRIMGVIDQAKAAKEREVAGGNKYSAELCNKLKEESVETKQCGNCKNKMNPAKDTVTPGQCTRPIRELGQSQTAPPSVHDRVIV
jgi:hypothetical protein